jgi:hypothetical protein
VPALTEHEDLYWIAKALSYYGYTIVFEKNALNMYDLSNVQQEPDMKIFKSGTFSQYWGTYEEIMNYPINSEFSNRATLIICKGRDLKKFYMVLMIAIVRFKMLSIKAVEKVQKDWAPDGCIGKKNIEEGVQSFGEMRKSLF